MSCPRKLFLSQQKSHFSGGSLFSETSKCSLALLSGSYRHFVRHYMKSLLFFQTSDRGWPACGRLRRQTSARTKTSVHLKITLVDMPYPKDWTESLPLCRVIFSCSCLLLQKPGKAPTLWATNSSYADNNILLPTYAFVLHNNFGL